MSFILPFVIFSVLDLIFLKKEKGFARSFCDISRRTFSVIATFVIMANNVNSG